MINCLLMAIHRAIFTVAQLVFEPNPTSKATAQPRNAFAKTMPNEEKMCNSYQHTDSTAVVANSAQPLTLKAEILIEHREWTR